MREPRDWSHVGRYVKRRGLGQEAAAIHQKDTIIGVFLLGADRKPDDRCIS